MLIAAAGVTSVVLAAASLALARAGEDALEPSTSQRRPRPSPSPSPSRSVTPTTGTRVPQTTGTTTALPPTPPDPPLDAAVEELRGFVSEVRGHRFREPVRVVRLDDTAFEERLRDDLTRQELDRAGSVSETLGLAGDGGDYARSYIDEMARTTRGLHSSAERLVLVRGTPGSPVRVDDRLVLVHELTHALDHQHFPFDRPELQDPASEISFGHRAVAEGNADRVMSEWARRHGLVLGAGDGRTGGAAADIHAAYDHGDAFVSAIAGLGGEAAVDRALDEPPTTSEQVLHPDRYIAGDRAVGIERPPAGGPRDEGPPIGELRTSRMLATAMDPARAAAAAAGWGGDRSFIWTQPAGAGAGSCMRIIYAMDTPQDLDELESAFVTWAAAQPDRSVTRTGDRLDVTTCSPR